MIEPILYQSVHNALPILRDTGILHHNMLYSSGQKYPGRCYYH